MRTPNRYKQATREHINALRIRNEKLEGRAEAAEGRIAAAERAQRDLEIEKDRWKREAKELRALLSVRKMLEAEL